MIQLPEHLSHISYRAIADAIQLCIDTGTYDLSVKEGDDAGKHPFMCLALGAAFSLEHIDRSTNDAAHHIITEAMHELSGSDYVSLVAHLGTAGIVPSNENKMKFWNDLIARLREAEQ